MTTLRIDGRKINELRNAIGWGVRELARIAHVDVGQLSRVERNQAKGISAVQLAAICRALGVPMDEVMISDEDDGGMLADPREVAARALESVVLPQTLIEARAMPVPSGATGEYWVRQIKAIDAKNRRGRTPRPKREKSQ